VISDEVSALKVGGVLHGSVVDIVDRAIRFVGMTATPLENSPEETYELLRVIDTEGLWSQTDFEDLLVFTSDYQASKWTWVPPKFESFADGGDVAFKEYLSTVTLRRTSHQAGIRLPARVGKRDIWVPLYGRQNAVYERARSRNGLPGFHARQKAGRFVGNESSILDAALELLLPRVSDEKAIPYAENLGFLKLAEVALSRSRVHCVQIDGQVPQKVRRGRLEAFEHDPKVRVLLGSQSLERGLNIQHCRHLVSLDPSFNPARETQREGRIVRMGSPHDTYEHMIFLPDTPDGRAKFAALARKQDLSRLVGLG
jgi:SNF2 family DNA or RNA helicase